MTTTTQQWDMMTPDQAEEMAAKHAARVVWAADGMYGFARLMRHGETLAQAVADFEAGGEPCVRSEEYAPDA